MKKNGGRVARIKRKYGEDAFEHWGKKGGSPILLAHKYHRTVKGYRVTHN